MFFYFQPGVETVLSRFRDGSQAEGSVILTSSFVRIATGFQARLPARPALLVVRLRQALASLRRIPVQGLASNKFNGGVRRRGLARP